MAKENRGTSNNKASSKKAIDQMKKKTESSSDDQNQDPIAKIKVQRNRRRLYQTPIEDNEQPKPSSKPKSKSTSKKKKPAAKKSMATREKSSKKKFESNEKVLVSTIDKNKEKKDDHPSSKLKESNRIVERYSAIASGSVLLPIPGVDIVYITGVQIKMIRDLSTLYGVDFKKNRGKSVVTSLLSGILSNNFMFSAAPFMVRYIPVLGFLAAPLSIVLFSSALTYSVGKVFIQHFEAGGTFLNFKPEEVKAHFKKEFEKKYQVMKDDS